MKLVDRMKDEELGTAILYNFTKGYGKPVPLELYDVVLPLLYHDFYKRTCFNIYVHYRSVSINVYKMKNILNNIF